MIVRFIYIIALRLFSLLYSITVSEYAIFNLSILLLTCIWICSQFLAIMNSTAVYILWYYFFPVTLEENFVVICESKVFQLLKIFENIRASYHVRVSMFPVSHLFIW